MQWLKKARHVLPILSIGATWLIYALVSEFRRPIHFIFCAVLSVWVFFALRLLLRRLPEEKKDPVPEKTPEQVKKKTKEEPAKPFGAEYLQKIQELDAAIPDVVVSAKLKQISALMERIFAVVQKQPERTEDIRQLMDYYLPTTMRLLEKYVVLQDQKVKGENIGDAMQKIEGLLDSIIVALQKQLDDMFRMDMVDITAEIRVMEKKLAAEGLAANDDFKEIL